MIEDLQVDFIGECRKATSIDGDEVKPGSALSNDIHCRPGPDNRDSGGNSH